MKLYDLLACPDCGGPLTLLRGYLVCGNWTCAQVYEIRDGTPRFVESDSYTGSFSWEWARHQATLVDSVSGTQQAHDMFVERTGLTEQDIKGKLVLDAGCGTGRFMEVIKDFGGIPVGVDMSYSVDQAREVLGCGSLLVQADLLRLPFKKAVFDVVFSIGVLHHTPSTYRAFLALASALKQGGTMAVWVYSNEGWQWNLYNKVSDTYRLVTTHLPRPLLYHLCRASVPLYYLHRLPVVGPPSCILAPSSLNENRVQRVLDTFDWYSPRYQWKHTYSEVEGWAQEAGLTDVQRLKVPVSIKAVKR